MTAPWVLRVASHPRHGGGHLSRMQVLGFALQQVGAEVRFVLDPGSDAARVRLAGEGFTCVDVGHEGAGSWAGAVLDGYEILRDEADRWRQAVPFLAVIDDFLKPPAGAALVINGAPHLDGAMVSNVPALMGPDFALIDPRYAAIPDRDRTEPVKHVLVSFGRLDPDNIAVTVLHAIARMSTELAVTVVAASDSPHLEALRAALAPFGSQGTLELDMPDLVAPLGEADLAIGAGGVSLLERMAAGVPSLTVAIIENQAFFVQGAVRCGGTVDGGTASTATPEGIAGRLRTIFVDVGMRQRVSAAGRAIIDGRGGERVAARLLQIANQSIRPEQMRVGVA